MRTKSGKVALCAGLALVMALGVVLADRAAGGRWHGRDGGDGRGAIKILRQLAQDPEVQEQLGLAEAQVSQLRSIWSETRSSLGRQKDAISAQRAELRALIMESGTTRKAIEAKASDLIRARGETAHQMLESFLDARDVLTTDQRTKLRQLIRDRRGRHQDSGSEEDAAPAPDFGD